MFFFKYFQPFIYHKLDTLIQTLESLHGEILKEYFICQNTTDPECAPLYDDVHGTQYALNVTREVIKAQSKLPHRYPNVKVDHCSKI